MDGLIEKSLKLSNLRGKNIVIHCPTQEQWDKVLVILEKEGIRWSSGGLPTTNSSRWKLYKDKSYIGDIWKKMSYSPADEYPGAQIIEAEDLIKANQIMEKPKPFSVNSNNPLLLQAWWNECKELGYYRQVNSETEATWKRLNSNYTKEAINLRTWKGIYLSNAHYIGSNTQMNFNLPADYEKALQYAKESIESEYWVENRQLNGIVLEVGTGKIKVTISKGKILAEKIIFDIDDVNKIAEIMTGIETSSWVTATFETVDIDYIKGITYNEIEQIQNAYKKLNS